MVTLTGLVRTFIVAAEPLNCLPYQDRKTIGFTNGWKLNLTFPQFRDVRDSYSSLKNYDIKQVNDDLFEADFGDFKTIVPLKVLCAIADVLERYKIAPLENGLFRVKGDNFELEGTSTMLPVFRELISGEYEAYYKDKIVLDIGGFQGESAVYFWLSGAKKIVIYEPASKYCQLIKKNVTLNQIDAEIHQYGIGNEYQIMLVDLFDPSVNVGDKPKKEIIKIKSIVDVINQSGADIAKIDCEGAETCLIAVPNEVLRKIPCYMLELHGKDVRKAVTAKFIDAGFKVTKTKNKSDYLSIRYFHT